MDLTNMIPGGAGEEKTPQQQLSKEEYAAMKKQQREEVWAEVDAQAQAVFQNGDSLKGFLDFMAQCNTQKTPNLLLIYGQNPEATVVKSYDYWKKEHRSPKSGVHGYTYMVSTEYEKDGEMRTGYAIGKGFDISQMSGKPLEERPQRSMEELIHAVLKDQPVRMQIADNLPEGIPAQYIPKQRTVYVRNGMEANTTFHAVNRELACAALDQHDGNYMRKKVNAQAYCAAYVVGKRYGADVSGFQFGKVAEMQANGQKDSQELRGFLNDVRQAAYTIRNHMERNFGEQEQAFAKDDFSFEEPPKQTLKKEILVLDDDDNELVLPKSEQIPSDFFRKGESVKAIVARVEMKNNSPYIVLSRTAPEFLERLFEMEVPEIYDGLITIKKIVRIPGERAKVAVESYDDRVDPVGACVGMKGSRIYSIVKELRNENIDVVNWTSNSQLLIQRALNPAKISSINLNEETKTAAVYLKPNEVSLAIGKGGLNIRLASMLTGYDIDVYRELEEEDVALDEFKDEIDEWIIDQLKGIGCDTAKSVLELSVEDLAKRTDLEVETVQEVVNILKSEFE